MVETRYIIKKKRKKIAAIMSLIASGVITALVIIAFLGRRVGSFTIKLNTTDVKLSLSEKYSFEEDTTYLMVNQLPSFDLNEYVTFLNDDKYDNEASTYEEAIDRDPQTGEINVIYYFKYTFYLKNVGSVPANYTMTLNITDNVKPSNVSYGYDDILRIKFYDNDATTDLHENETYAKRIRNGQNKYVDEHGDPIYSELKYDEEGTPGFYGYCKNFESDTTVFTKTVLDFKPEEVQRFTMIMWLDGNDTQSVGEAPDQGSIKLGLNINASQYFEN